jgi:biotin-(acetyl-CoA carboxylase) ligase
MYCHIFFRNSKVTVIKSNGKAENVTISGINDYGYLVVHASDGKTFSVQPDGNSFDLFKGLIAPK